MDETTVTLKTHDGIELQIYRWAPRDQPRAVVQIQHGLGEHASRYRRFAQALTDAGYLVYAPDARGSGRTAQGSYGRWGPDSWAGWVNDIHVLAEHISREHPDLSLALFGHSLGSFGTQQYLLTHSGEVDAVVLSGTGDVEVLADQFSGDTPLDLSSFNAPFEHRTGFEWLSRDEAEVDKYVADPACGWEAEPFRGMEELAGAADPDLLQAVRADVPILLVSGSDDPVGGGDGNGVRLTAQRYRDAGVQDVEVKIYPGARHEILNETNRDEVTHDILTFLGRTV